MEIFGNQANDPLDGLLPALQIRRKQARLAGIDFNPKADLLHLAGKPGKLGRRHRREFLAAIQGKDVHPFAGLSISRVLHSEVEVDKVFPRDTLSIDLWSGLAKDLKADQKNQA